VDIPTSPSLRNPGPIQVVVFVEYRGATFVFGVEAPAALSASVATPVAIARLRFSQPVVVQGRSSNASVWVGRTTLKWRRSRVATRVASRRSAIAMRLASVPPRRRSA
jgi:hypothetical protein